MGMNENSIIKHSILSENMFEIANIKQFGIKSVFELSANIFFRYNDCGTPRDYTKNAKKFQQRPDKISFFILNNEFQLHFMSSYNHSWASRLSKRPSHQYLTNLNLGKNETVWHKSRLYFIWGFWSFRFSAWESKKKLKIR